jgi:hypothetical protein
LQSLGAIDRFPPSRSNPLSHRTGGKHDFDLFDVMAGLAVEL